MAPDIESAVVLAYAICEVDDACRPDLNQSAVEVELASAPKLRSEVYGKPIVLVIVTAPVAPDTLIPLPATLEVTPELVMEGETEPTTVKAEQETPLVQEADEVATPATAVPFAPP